MFAIVNIAGFQETVRVGEKIRVPLLEGEADKKLTFGEVLMVSDGDNVTLGNPLVSGAVVEAKITEHGRDDKIRVAKMRRRKRYRRVHGHRQDFTEVEIMKITV